MRRLFLLLAALGIVACYGATRLENPDGGDATPDAGSSEDGASWPDGAVWWPDAEPGDVGPVCPDPGPPIEAYECDVLAQRGCEEGLACYAWTETTDDPCAREVYLSGCLAPGTGSHGDSCDAWCEPGLECFVTGEGTQCLHVCDFLGGEPRCPMGRICRPTDLPGLGACH